MATDLEKGTAHILAQRLEQMLSSLREERDALRKEREDVHSLVVTLLEVLRDRQTEIGQAREITASVARAESELRSLIQVAAGIRKPRR